MAAPPSIAIVGAGFAGVGMAITLKRAGFDDLTVIERGRGVGGVWRENRYPGAACDVPSDLYSFSFERRYPFARRYGEQRQILDYLRHCSRKFGVDEHLRLDTEVRRARFDPAAGGWHLELDGGDTLRADVLIAACGQLSRFALPAIPGLDDFTGPVFHSADWPAGLDVGGRRIGVVGTGASAIQIVPAIAEPAAHVDVFQRTAPYVIPKLDAEVGGRSAVAERLGRLGQWLFVEGTIPGLVGPRAASVHLRLLHRGLKRLQVREAGLRRTLTPDYPLGCKRVLLSDEYYPALMRPDVDLVTEPIERVMATGIRTRDGRERALDVIVCATGFKTSDPVAPMEVVGLEGRSLSDDAWAQGAEAYLGLTVPGFPNLFLLYGPNTNLGSGSIIYMLECQARYVLDAVHRLRDRGLAWIEVREGPHRAFAEEMQRRLDSTVWASCESWYRTPSGRITNNWPGLMTEYRHRTRRLRPGHYRAASRAS